MSNVVTHYKVRNTGAGTFAVIAETKSYGSTGPDPGRTIAERVVVDGVSREYGEMLSRELTKSDFVAKWPGDLNIFAIVPSVSRTVDMWTGPNSDEWADNPNVRLVY